MEVVKLLIDHGADIDRTYSLVGTAQNGHSNVVLMLLDYGANVNKGDQLSFAAKNRHIDVICILLSRYAEINSYTALCAKRNTDHNVLQVLREYSLERVSHCVFVRGMNMRMSSVAMRTISDFM